MEYVDYRLRRCPDDRRRGRVSPPSSIAARIPRRWRSSCPQACVSRRSKSTSRSGGLAPPKERNPPVRAGSNSMTTTGRTAAPPLRRSIPSTVEVPTPRRAPHLAPTGALPPSILADVNWQYDPAAGTGGAEVPPRIDAAYDHVYDWYVLIFTEEGDPELNGSRIHRQETP